MNNVFELTDSGTLNLAQAIIQNSCDDIMEWERAKQKYGYDYRDDPLVPEIPTSLHSRLTKMRSKKERQNAITIYYNRFYYNYRSKEKWAMDAERFIRGDAWFGMLTGVDGDYIADRLIIGKSDFKKYAKMSVKG